MPTAKSRLALTLEPHQRAVLVRLAQANQIPMSRIVSELLEAVTPYLGRAADFAERAAKLKGAGLAAELVASLTRAEDALQPSISDALQAVDDALSTAEVQGSPVPVAHAQRASAVASTPVPSNHGGQVITKGHRKPARKPVPVRGRRGRGP